MFSIGDKVTLLESKYHQVKDFELGCYGYIRRMCTSCTPFCGAYYIDWFDKEDKLIGMSYEHYKPQLIFLEKGKPRPGKPHRLTKIFS